MNIIEVKNLTKVFKIGDEKIYPLKDVSINFESGKIYCIFGTSGSGKTTLLNILAGLEKPTKGEVIINGHKLHKMNEVKLAIFRKKYIGFVFQSYNLLSTFTALENVTLPLIFQKKKKKIRQQLAKKMLKQVGLSKRFYHKPNELSGGQQQRVSIARAFINNPKIVFADEPTGNLDSKTTQEMMDLILSLAKEHNQTLIIVTHDEEISSYADVIIHLIDGKIESITDKGEEKDEKTEN